MTSLQKLALVHNSDDLMDRKYGFPSIPRHNQPHFYFVLVEMCVGMSFKEWDVAYAVFSAECDRGKRGFSRFPGGRGGNFSHDEMLAAKKSRAAAKAHLARLRKWWGFYPDEFGKFRINRWFYRFIFLVPYLKACADEELNRFDEVMWSSYVALSILRDKRHNYGVNGLNKIWVMGDKMAEASFMCNLVYTVWKLVMLERGIGPQLLYSQAYLTECPTMAKIAPEYFT